MTIDHVAIAEQVLRLADVRAGSPETTGEAADLACVADTHVALARLQFDRAQAILAEQERYPDRPIMVPSVDQIRRERDELVVEIDVLLDRKRQLDDEIATARVTIARLRSVQAAAVTAANQATARLYRR